MNTTMDLVWASLVAFFIGMLPLIKTYIITHFIFEKSFKLLAKFIRYALRTDIVFVTADRHYKDHDKKQSPLDCQRDHCRNIRHHRRRKR